MILKVFTKGDGPESRLALEVGHDIAEDGYEVEYYDLDEPEGGSFRSLYDIYTGVAFVVTQSDGRLVEIWQGSVPSESEVKNIMRL